MKFNLFPFVLAMFHALEALMFSFELAMLATKHTWDTIGAM